MKRPLILVFFLLVLATPWAGCQQNAVTVPVRSLERSGRSAFLCISDPAAPEPGMELRACSVVTPTGDTATYTTVPHVIGLVTQEARGELAVVDVTAGVVVDVDPTLPGANFLPVGALPTDVVATPGSNASFVSVGDPIRPGIFAFSSAHLFLPRQDHTTPPSLAGAPACSLPAVPTQLAIVSDPTLDSGAARAHCPGVTADIGPFPAGFDLSHEAQLFGTSKIVALMPDLGEVVVIDAQTLLTRPAGSFDPCPIERTLALRGGAGESTPGSADGGIDAPAGDAPGPSDADVAADTGADGAQSTEGGACISPPPLVIAPPAVAPHPISMALADDGRLFISDDRASVIHVVDLSDPCSPVEAPPLLPVSALDPTRAVVTNAIAVSPLTSDDRRFVYAVDVKDNGSVMMFDVSQGATQRTPLFRPDVQFNQGEPPDRIGLSSPVVSLSFARHEIPAIPPSTSGVIPRAVLCNPNDTADPYRFTDYTSGLGAGPRVLRGIFGFLALADGRVVVVDIDDFDAPCRRPAGTDDLRLGCSGQTVDPTAFPSPPVSQEASCRVFERHRVRSNQYFTNVIGAGQHAPAMQGFPLLHNVDGTTLTIDPSRPESDQRPKMLGPSIGGDVNAQQLIEAVAGLTAVSTDLNANPRVDRAGDPLFNNVSKQNWVAFDLREPRAHLTQAWSMTYEGVFAGGSTGKLHCARAPADPSMDMQNNIDCERGDNPSHFEFVDPTIGFCRTGVQGADLALAQGAKQGDIVSITSDLPDPADAYWSTEQGVCSRQTCEARYGTAANPQPAGRDFTISRAFQDHLVLDPNPARDAQTPVACCFPYPLTYALRGGAQWIVTGSSTGFVHRMVPDPSNPQDPGAACVLSCDPALNLRNSRVVALDAPAQASDIPGYDDPRVFRNAQLRFVIWNPQDPSCATAGTGTAPDGGISEPCVRRDMFFSFQEVGGFEPMALGISATALVIPQSLTFVPGLEQLAIVDPVAQGLMLFDLARLGVVQSIF